MTSITRSIIIDVARKNQIPDVVAKSGDIASRFINATIKNDGVTYVIDPTSTILLDVLRPDGQRDAFACELNQDGTVKAPLTQWVLGCYGKVKASISIINGDQRLTTTNFIIDVQESEFTDYPSGTEEHDILVDLVQDMKDFNIRLGIVEEKIEDLGFRQFTEIGEDEQLVPTEDLAVSGIFFKKL